LVPGSETTQKDIGELSTRLENALKKNVVITASDDIMSPEDRKKIDKEKILLYKMSTT